MSVPFSHCSLPFLWVSLPFHCETSSRVLSALIRTKRYNIADQLKTSLDAIQSVRKIIYRKTDTKGTPGLYGFALKHGIFSMEETEKPAQL